MSKCSWLSMHIYYGEYSPDDLIMYFLPPYIDSLFSKAELKKYFFIRYNDETGRHIRLRLFLLAAKQQFIITGIQESLNAYFMRRNYAHENLPFVRVIPYVPETKRYGGLHNLAVCENYFFLSSNTVSESLNHIKELNYGKKIVLALQLHYITIKALTDDYKEAVIFLKTFLTSWQMLPFRNMSQLRFYRLLYEKNLQSSDLVSKALSNFKSLDKNSEKNIPRYFQNWYLGNQKHFSDLVVGNRKKKLELGLSLLHMTNNRVGIDNLDESFIAYLLLRFIQDAPNL